MAYIVKVDNKEYKLDVERRNNEFKVLLNNEKIEAKLVSESEKTKLALIINNKLYTIELCDGNTISVNEEEYIVEVFDEQIHKLIKTRPDAAHIKEVTITVPIPGLIIDIEVKEGDSVKSGQGLAIVEAMKMQNEIKAPRDGIVKKIFVQKGQTVNSREKLLIIE